MVQSERDRRTHLRAGRATTRVAPTDPGHSSLWIPALYRGAGRLCVGMRGGGSWLSRDSLTRCARDPDTGCLRFMKHMFYSSRNPATGQPSNTSTRPRQAPSTGSGRGQDGVRSGFDSPRTGGADLGPLDRGFAPGTHARRHGRGVQLAALPAGAAAAVVGARQPGLASESRDGGGAGRDGRHQPGAGGRGAAPAGGRRGSRGWDGARSWRRLQ